MDNGGSKTTQLIAKVRLSQPSLMETNNKHSSSSPRGAPHKSTSLDSLPDRMEAARVDDHVVEKKAKVETNGNGKDDAQDVLMEAVSANDDEDFMTVTLIAKFAKERIVLDGLPLETTIGQVKQIIQQRTRILPKRQKLVGLVALSGGAKGVHDELLLSELKQKGTKATATEEDASETVITHSFILMGTPEEEIFVDPSQRDDLPDVVDDFELDFNAGSQQWLQHVANNENLKQFTEKTAVHIMNPPRTGKPLLVLDLDHTLLDFSSRQIISGPALHQQEATIANMKRPYMNQFLTTCYRHYDLVVWSQTSWRWLETKLTELGMVSHPGYRFAFVLDKTSMFTITSTKRDGTSVKHHVKPLQIIWSKFPQWGSHNTVHVDDLSRNFALNLTSGLKIKAYYRKKSAARRDSELLGLGRYLEHLAKSQVNFDKVDFTVWSDDVKEGRLTERREDES